MTEPPSFKERNRPMQEVVREHQLLRNHNLQFKEGEAQHSMLFIAEGAVACLMLEYFVRIVLGDAADGATLYNLLEMAVARKLLRVPWDDQQDGIKKICNVRNTILHANFAQAASQAGHASPEEYFKREFAGEVENMYKISDYLMKQIDPETGQRYSPVG